MRVCYVAGLLSRPDPGRRSHPARRRKPSLDDTNRQAMMEEDEAVGLGSDLLERVRIG